MQQAKNQYDEVFSEHVRRHSEYPQISETTALGVAYQLADNLVFINQKDLGQSYAAKTKSLNQTFDMF